MKPLISNTVSVIKKSTYPLSMLSTSSAEPSVCIQSTTAASCMECRMIDMDIHYNTMQYSTATIINTPSEYNYPLRLSLEELQIANIKTLNGNDASLNSIKSVTDFSPTTEVDTTSFIVVRDPHDANVFLPSASSNLQDIPFQSNVTSIINTSQPSRTELNNIRMNSQQRCSDCCFCNPDLHKRSRSISSACSYCDRLNDRWKTTSPRDNSDLLRNKSTNTQPLKYMETQSKTDHTHIRTRSKDSDSVSLKCTKINTKLHRILPEDIFNEMFNDTEKDKEDITDLRTKNSNKYGKPPKDPAIISPPKVASPVAERKTKATESMTKTPRSATKSFRLPSPFINNANSTYAHSYDSLTSTSSSSPCSSSISSSPDIPNKTYSTIPLTRNQNQTAAREPTLPAIANNNIRKSRYQHFYGQSRSGPVDDRQVKDKDKMDSNQNVEASGKHQHSGKSTKYY